MPDTGSLEGLAASSKELRDLTQLLTQIVEILRRPEIERIARASVALGADEPAQTRSRTAFYRTRGAGSAAVATRAIERGELPAGTDPEAVIEFLVAPPPTCACC